MVLLKSHVRTSAEKTAIRCAKLSPGPVGGRLCRNFVKSPLAVPQGKPIPNVSRVEFVWLLLVSYRLHIPAWGRTPKNYNAPSYIYRLGLVAYADYPVAIQIDDSGGYYSHCPHSHKRAQRIGLSLIYPQTPLRHALSPSAQ